MSWRHPRPLLIFGGIFAATIALHLPALLYSRPFCCDNLYILEWAHGASLRDVIEGDTRFPAEWRPLPHLLVWAQYRLWGVGTLAPYFMVNLGIWAGAVWLLFRFIQLTTGSTAGAAVGIAFLLTARRTGTLTEFVMGSQTGLACLFGLAAMNVAFIGPASRWRTVAVGLLLLLAGLGKEYGLAFAAGLLVWSLLMRRRDLAAAGAGALMIYVALRLATTSHSVMCDEQAFFNGRRDICIDPTTAMGVTTVMQMAYNTCVALAHTLFPGFFGGDGLVGVAPRRLLQSAFWLTLIVAGVRRSPLTLLGLLIVTTTAALHAPLFRSRNTLVGLTMLAVVIAFGFQHLREWCRQRNWTLAFQLLCVAIVLACISRASIIPPNVRFTARASALDDPCTTLDQELPVDPSFITHVKRVYGLPDPHCSESASERVLPRHELIPPSDRDDWM